MPGAIREVQATWGRSTVFKTEKSEENIGTGPLTPEGSLTIEKERASSNAGTAASLPCLQSSLCATILEDTVTQLRILVECNNELRIIKTYSDWKYILSRKFDINQLPSAFDELDRIDPHNLCSDEYKINKLDYDRKYITETILAIYVDLCVNGGFKALENSVKSVIDRDIYCVNLEEDESKNKALRRELNKQLRHQRNHIKTVIYDTDVKIDDLRTEVEDSVLKGECRSRYVNNWQRARTEQYSQKINEKEGVYLKSLEYFKQRTDYEQRVHMEIELLMNISHNESLQKVEECMSKYEKDVEAIDIRIHRQKNDYLNMYEKRVVLEETFKLHDKQIKDWIYFKEQREKTRLYREKMTHSAIIVQAWWRGLLVRRQLGPYKLVFKKSKAERGKKRR